VVGVENELERARILLVSGTEKILKELFNIIGIQAPERM
jgi:arginyl-tRNA synthetase